MSDQDPSQSKLERLESERRKDRLTIQALETRLTGLEEQLSGANKSVKSLQGEMKRLTGLLSGTEQFDTEIAKLRIELGKMIEKKEKQREKQGEDRLKLILTDLETVNSSITEIKQLSSTITQLKKRDKNPPG